MLGKEELYAPDACACKRLCDLFCHVFSLAQLVLGNGKRLPALAIVATLLYMSYGRTEEGGAVFLCDGKEGKLRVEVDKLLDNNFLYIASTSFHGCVERFFELRGVFHDALAVA